jgi:meiotic recombination protein DMC1
MQKNTKDVEMDCEEEESLVSSGIDKLQDFGVNAADINKLKAAGICTVKGLLMVTRKELLNIKGISDQKVDKMIEAAQKSEVSASLIHLVNWLFEGKCDHGEARKAKTYKHWQ